MRPVKFLLIGIFFGIIITKSQVISWYRIYEMFHFDSFHMYGIIGSAVLLGIMGVALIKKYQLKSTEGITINFSPKKMSISRYLMGGIIFGLGWAMTGACPGPMFTLIGYGYGVFLVVLASAILGTLTYGIIRKKLPH